MANKLVIAFVVLIIAYFGNKFLNSPLLVKSPVVETRTGKLEGLISKTRDGREFFEYLGIPYAEPPVGDLRFEPPEPLTQKWDGIKDASTYGSPCTQFDAIKKVVKGQENCLFLNVHSAKLEGANLPVMVWIHGGLFSFGAGSDYRPDYMLEEDVVLVTINYRLASFGFLNTGDGIIRGNMGLKDQNMALHWVKENIAQFGGNPKDVTIFGESAGGVSVHFQVLSPMSKGLFHKAIAQSGVATLPWSTYPTPSKQAERFSKQLKCSGSNSKEIVKCLKGRSALEIVTIHEEMSDPIRPLISVFLPTIEKDISDGKTFLAQQPKVLIESGQFNKVPFMAGVNSAEGLLVTAPTVSNKNVFASLATNWEETIIPLMFLPVDTDSKILEKIRNFYLDGTGKLDAEEPLKHMQNLTSLFSDWMWKYGFHNGMTSHAKQLSPSNQLYIYYYSYDGEFNLADLFMALKGDYPPIVEIIRMKVSTWFKRLIGKEIVRYGACHSDELALIFNIPGLCSVPKNSKDYEFSKQLVTLWVAFAKTEAKELKSLDFMGQKWMPQELNKPLKYMQLDTPSKMIHEPDSARINFWHSIGSF